MANSRYIVSDVEKATQLINSAKNDDYELKQMAVQDGGKKVHLVFENSSAANSEADGTYWQEQSSIDP